MLGFVRVARQLGKQPKLALAHCLKLHVAIINQSIKKRLAFPTIWSYIQSSYSRKSIRYAFPEV